LLFGVPGISDGIELGDKVNLILETELFDNNDNPVAKTSGYFPEIRCSFDPNDKASNPDRVEGKVLISEDVLYHIRFQNTGNDTAYDISIYDTLSQVLHPNTFEFMATSHREHLTVTRDENVIHFRFDNIYLPDSNINEEASHGYVSFKVNAMEGTAENTELQNTAFIYFDENPAVVTNQTENLLVLTLTDTAEEDLFSKIEVSPNPSSGLFFISDPESLSKRVEVRNTAGQLLDIQNMDRNRIRLDLSSNVSGLYYLIFKDENGKVVQAEKVMFLE